MCKRAWRASVGVCGALSQVVVHLRLSIKPVSRDQSARSFLLTESRCVVCVRRVWAGGGRGGCWRRRRTDLAWVVGSRKLADRPARRGILKDGQEAQSLEQTRRTGWAVGEGRAIQRPHTIRSSVLPEHSSDRFVGGTTTNGPPFSGVAKALCLGTRAGSTTDKTSKTDCKSCKGTCYAEKFACAAPDAARRQQGATTACAVNH